MSVESTEDRPWTGGDAARAARPRRILVLDDEPMILMDLQFAVEDEGAEPLGARTVDEALHHVAGGPVDAAILDVNLGSGATCEPVARRLRELDVPFVLHTGDLHRHGELVTSIGAAVVPKPTPGHLVARRALDMLGEGT